MIITWRGVVLLSLSWMNRLLCALLVDGRGGVVSYILFCTLCTVLVFLFFPSSLPSPASLSYVHLLLWNLPCLSLFSWFRMWGTGVRFFRWVVSPSRPLQPTLAGEYD